MDPPEGIAAADARLGRAFPLPTAPLPLARWVEVALVAPDGAEVEWNLDDSRPGAPGRLALYAGASAAEPQLEAEPEQLTIAGRAAEHRSVALAEAQPSLRPVHELRWEAGGLHLRLTGQGPWELDELLAVAASIEP